MKMEKYGNLGGQNRNVDIISVWKKFLKKHKGYQLGSKHGEICKPITDALELNVARLHYLDFIKYKVLILCTVSTFALESNFAGNQNK